MTNSILANKRVTSNLNYFTQILIFIIISIVTGIACFNFGYGRMGLEGGLIAACISLVLFASYLRNNRKHNKLNGVVEWVLILFFVIFEILVIGANFVTQSAKTPNQKVEAQRISINAEIDRLSSRIVKPKTNTDKYDNRLIEDDIRKEKTKLEGLPEYKNNESKFFESASALLNLQTEIVELVFNISIGGLLAIGCGMTGSRVNSYTCPYLIKHQLQIQAEIDELIKPVTKSGTATNRANQRTDDNPTNGKAEIQTGLDAGIAHIESHEVGQVVKAKLLKQKMNTSRASESTIMSILYKKGGYLVKGKNGNTAQYKRCLPNGLQIVKAEPVDINNRSQEITT